MSGALWRNLHLRGCRPRKAAVSQCVNTWMLLQTLQTHQR